MIFKRLTLALLASALAVSAATAQSDPAPLRIVTSFDIGTMNPAVDGFWMQEFGVAELLMKFYPDGTNQPWLLESLENKDALTWVATVRDGITFQNGKVLDADAVLAVIKRQMAVSDSATGAVPEGTTFVKTGNMEITISTVAPWPELPGILSNEAIFLIYDAEAADAVGDDWTKLTNAGIYTGPYTVTSLTSARLDAERNDSYWNGEPALPGLSVSFVTDPNARILAVQNDEADIALYPPIAARPVVDATPGIHFNTGTTGTGGFLGFMNVNQPPFDDVRVRQALMQTIDYDEIANVVFGGALAEAKGLYNESFPWARQTYVTDPTAAAALLDEAGWLLDGDMRRKDGEALELKVVIYPQQPDLVPLSGALQAQVRKLGIGVKIQSVDDVYAALGKGGVDWDLGISSEGTVSWGVTSPFLTRYLGPAGNRNFASYANPEVHALIAELKVTVDTTRRDEILGRIQDILVSEDPYVFAFNIHKGRVVVNETYAGYEPGFALYHVSPTTAPSPAQ
ncbi:ABC transporter substrate-binding protein [Devosia sp. 2618]|uniref:ABC transporter substrate-binding protein n=1 Tax=Devosia sp. 2618 TaxID=3156454 RepID=UPI003399DF2E